MSTAPADSRAPAQAGTSNGRIPCRIGTLSAAPAAADSLGAKAPSIRRFHRAITSAERSGTVTSFDSIAPAVAPPGSSASEFKPNRCRATGRAPDEVRIERGRDQSSSLARRYASIARRAVACCGHPDKLPVHRRPLRTRATPSHDRRRRSTLLRMTVAAWRKRYRAHARRHSLLANR